MKTKNNFKMEDLKMNKLFDLTFNNLFYVDVWYDDDENDNCVTVFEGIVKFDNIEELKNYFSNCYKGTNYCIDISRLRVDELPIDYIKF